MDALINPDTRVTDREWWQVGIEALTGGFRYGTAVWRPVTDEDEAKNIAAAMLSCDVLDLDGEVGVWLLGTHPDVTIRIAGALDRDGMIEFGGPETGYRIVVEAP